MNLFERGGFRSHAGLHLSWKIDCDALSPGDWATIAHVIGTQVLFGSVEGVPRGGDILADLLQSYVYIDKGLLIVDDVLTTGQSMEVQRAGRDAQGVVLFSRGVCPAWVTPIWQLNLGAIE